jgi:GGDEF domain-containing protein
MRTVQQPIRLAGQPVLPSLSIGVALSAPHDDAGSVLAAADRALYAAKAAGRGRWQLAADGPELVPRPVRENDFLRT